MENTPVTPTPTPTSDSTSHLMEVATPWLIYAGIAAVVLGILYLITTRVVIHQWIVWREANGFSLGNALTRKSRRRYIPKQPRDLLQVKATLMCHKNVRAAFAPSEESGEWLKERGTTTQTYTDKDGKQATKEVPESTTFDFSAWLSPYPRAVKEFIKKAPSYNSKNTRYLPREEVRTIANRVTIREASSTEAQGLVTTKNERKFFVIDLSCAHSTADKIRSLKPSIIAALKLGDLREIKHDDPQRVTYLATMPGVQTALSNENMPTGSEFIQKHPANASLTRVPLAVTEDGGVWAVKPMHTLIVGVTGSGKSSPLNMITAQLSDAVLAGTATIDAIDPKANGDLRTKWGRSGIYRSCGEGADDYVRTIREFWESMESFSTDTGALTKGDITASALTVSDFKASTQTPLRVLMIDELPSMINDVKNHPEGKRAIELLNQILRKGRSLGHIVIAASQTLEKADLEGVDRNSFVYKVALRLDSTYQSDYILGSGASAAGFDSKDIPNSAGYIGVALVRDETGDPVKVRFPFFPNEQIVEVMKKHLPDSMEEAEEALTETTPVAPRPDGYVSPFLARLESLNEDEEDGEKLESLNEDEDEDDKE